MDTEKLIWLVMERKALWDTSSKNYHNREVARQLWAEIAELMNSTSPIVKGKWQNLRDMFRREHAKKMKTPSGSAGQHDKVSSWKFYEQLLFLADAFSSRQMKSNNLPLSCQAFQDSVIMGQPEDGEELNENSMGPYSETVSLSEDMQDGFAGADANQAEPLPCSCSTSFKKPDMRMKWKLAEADAVSQLLALEKRKIEQLERISDERASTHECIKDEDYHFVMSLLPHLREIPKARKLAVRMKIQQVLMTEDNRQDHLNSNDAS